MKYRLLRPEAEKAGKKYPLVLFLHGAGERGDDNQKQLVHGGQMWLNPVNREEYPAFVLAPSVLRKIIGLMWVVPSRLYLEKCPRYRSLRVYSAH